tara:strand:- start:904 stop:1128 length:225 start_codon:yes stop_codon:yes gene_type:complete
MEWRPIERDEEHLLHPIRGVTLVDGSKILIDRVTGIPSNFEKLLEEVEKREEKYKQRIKLKHQIDDIYQNKEGN